MNSSMYLDALRARLNLPSDYATAKRLGISTQRVSNYRTGKQDMAEDLIPKVADLLGVDPVVVYADIAAARATTAFSRMAMTRLAELARASAATKKAPAKGLVSKMVAEDGIEPPTRGFSIRPARAVPALRESAEHVKTLRILRKVPAVASCFV